jgi:hypothetical protein
MSLRDLARRLAAEFADDELPTTCDSAGDMKPTPSVQSQVDNVCRYRLHGIYAMRSAVGSCPR